MDFKGRESEHFDDLIYQSPEFTLGKLATVTLRSKKSASFLNLGQARDDPGLNLWNVVTHINESIRKEQALYKGIKVRVV